jgi:hypothetical protein
MSKYFDVCCHQFNIVSCPSLLPINIKTKNIEASTNFSGYLMKPDLLSEGKKIGLVSDEGAEENMWN